MDAILLDKGIPGMRMERLRRASPFEMKVLHAHTFWEIYYLLEGECIYFIDGRSYALERGALVFVGTNVLHRTLAERHERILIELDPATLADFGMRLPLLEQNASIAVQLPPSSGRWKPFSTALRKAWAVKRRGMPPGSGFISSPC